jgi:predicted TIM-barrel fold metal-dependent hydrolase
MLIDMHAHFYGEALFTRLAARAEVPRVERSGARRFMVTPTSRFELHGGFLSVRARLDYMDSVGIDRQLITFPGALGPDVLPIADSVPLVRDVNDELASTCRADPDRFAALCGLPLADIDASITELERACRLFGIIGAILPSNYFLSLARLDALRPLFAAGDAMGAHFMLHPGLRHDEPMAPKQYEDLGIHRASTIDLHAGITHALLTLIHSDVQQRYPNLGWQVVNLGGAFPMMVERMDHIVATRDPDAPRPSTLLGGIMFDSASLGPRALELAVSVFGAERIMLGTDYPIFATDVATRALADAAIPEVARAAIASGNALRILERSTCGST